MAFIKLTLESVPLYINTDHIIEFYGAGLNVGSFVILTNGISEDAARRHIVVNESPETIMRRIKEAERRGN